MSKRKQFDMPFYPMIPPIFLQGGLLYFPNNLGSRVAFLTMQDQELVKLVSWLRLFEEAERQLAMICYRNQRIVTPNEQDQLEWLRFGGHMKWHLFEEDALQYMAKQALRRIKERDEQHQRNLAGLENVTWPTMRKMGTLTAEQEAKWRRRVGAKTLTENGELK